MMRFGLDRLLADRALRKSLAGRRTGLLAHPASVTPGLVHALDALAALPDVRLTTAFGPQHGLRGDKQDNMVESADFVDPALGIPVHSLYGEVRRPTAAMMEELDVLLVDLQDLGCRIYTFITTLRYVLEEAARLGKSVWVLDRPNPVGRPVEGLTLRPGWESFVGAGALPMRHGLTLGELGGWFIDSLRLQLDYRVIELEGWQPGTGPGYGWPLGERNWVNPSPNAPNLGMARCYAGTVMLEGTTLSEGRGTTRPLELFGAPDIDARALAGEMRRLAPEWMTGCRIRSCWFEPTFHKHAGRLCEGLQFHVDDAGYDHGAFRPWRLQALAFKALRTLQPAYPLWRDFPYEYERDRLAIDLINGSPLLREWVDDASATPADLDAIARRDEDSWCAERERFLLYPVSEATPPRECELLVVGGGVNGAGIALDAAGRGISTVLCEQHDLASHTSSASTKLVHGGLRYLEHFDFDLVRKALQEREVLLAAAAHIIRPLLFVLPHDSHLRPAWMIRAGLFLYDHLAKRRSLPASRAIDLRSHPAGAALEGQYRRGFVYADAWVDDSRLVVLNAVGARERGAQVLTRTRCTALARTGTHWRATLESADGVAQALTARAVVNATGPWVTRFIDEIADTLTARRLRLVKGSHIVVRRLYDHPYAYIFQNPDRRIVFAIPYEDAFTLIGTTDVDYLGDPGEPVIDEAERSYLVAMANRYFARDLDAGDVLWTYSGVRPLLDDESSDAASVTRDYSLELECESPPLLSVYGGKITTYRRLAEEAVNRLAPLLGQRTPGWTRFATLPGGDMPRGDLAAFRTELAARRPWLAGDLARRYARAYGTRVEGLLGDAASPADLGAEVLPGLFEREIAYLRKVEWAQTAEDILFRRSKLGLHLPIDATATLDRWLAEHPALAP